MVQRRVGLCVCLNNLVGKTAWQKKKVKPRGEPTIPLPSSSRPHHQQAIESPRVGIHRGALVLVAALGAGYTTARSLRTRALLDFCSGGVCWACLGWCGALLAAVLSSNPKENNSLLLVLLLLPYSSPLPATLHSHIHPCTTHRAPLRSGCLQDLPGRRARGPLRRRCPPPRGRNEVRRSAGRVCVVHAGAPGNSRTRIVQHALLAAGGGKGCALCACGVGEK